MIVQSWFSCISHIKTEPSETRNITMSKSNTTQKVRLFNLLAKGQEVTTAEAAHRCSIANVSAVISRLRDDGIQIHTNRRTNKSGKPVYKYSLKTAGNSRR